MSKDKSGQARLDACADKRREKLEAEKVKPKAVDIWREGRQRGRRDWVAGEEGVDCGGSRETRQILP